MSFFFLPQKKSCKLRDRCIQYFFGMSLECAAAKSCHFENGDFPKRYSKSYYYCICLQIVVISPYAFITPCFVTELFILMIIYEAEN